MREGKSLKETQALFKKEAALQPGNPDVWFGLSLCQESLGDTEVACQSSYEALKQGFGNPLTEVYLVRAQELSYFSQKTGQFTALLEALSHNTTASVYNQSLRAWYQSYHLRREGDFDSSRKMLSSLGLMTAFQINGPYDNEGKSGWAEEYPPEKSISFDTVVSGKLVPASWYEPQIGADWGVIDLGALFRPNEQACGYVLTAVKSLTSGWLALRLGGSGLKVWVNQEEVFTNKADRRGRFDQDHVPVYLHQGWNILMIKSCRLDGDWLLTARITQPDGSPVTGLEYSSQPNVMKQVVASLPPYTDKGNPPVLDRGSIPELERICRDDPKNAMAFSLLALMYNRRDIPDRDAHLSLWAADSAVSLYPNCIFFRKVYVESQPDVNLRRQALESAYAVDTMDVQTLNLLGDLDSRGGFRDRAMDRLKAATGINPEHGVSWFNLGLEYRKRGWNGEARACFARVTSLLPMLTDGWLQLATLQDTLLPRSLVEEWVKKASKLDALHTGASDRLIGLALESGKYQEYQALLQKRIILEPYNASYYQRLAETAYSQDKDTECLSWLEKGLALTPYDSGLLKLKGDLYKKQGDNAKALDCWRKALLAKPNDTWLTNYLAWLEPNKDKYYSPYQVTLAQATATPPTAVETDQANVVYLLDQSITRVYDDGNSSQYRHEIVQILTEKGVSSQSRKTVAYSPGRQKIELIRARVIKPDGTQQDAKSMGEYNASDAGARLYYDYSVRQYQFSGIEPGAIVELEYTIDDIQTNPFGDYFGDIAMLGNTEPTRVADYVLLTPASRKFNFYLERIPQQPEVTLSDDNKTRTYRVKLMNLPRVEVEPNMPSWSETLPYLKVSTFDTWDHLATWYWNLIKESFDAPQDLKDKVHELTANKKTQIDKVRALYDYTVTDIRYLGLEFGIGGYKPHKAMDIYRARYGDCKDKATLLITMLNEIGIPAEIVLIRTRDLGKVDMTLPSLGLFNHAICHIPNVDGTSIWLDGTAMYTGMDEYPVGDQGCEVFCVTSTGGTFRVTTTLNYSQNSAHFNTEINLNADGSAEGIRETQQLGVFAGGMRYNFSNLSKTQELLEQQFNAVLPGTRVSEIETSDFKNLSIPSEIKFNFHVPKMGARTGTQIQVFGNLFPLRLTESYTPRTERIHPMKFRACWVRSITTRYTLPDGFTVDSLPSSLELDKPFGKAKVDITKEGNTVVYKEYISMTVWDLSASDYSEFRNWCQQIDRKEQERIVIRKQ